mgnify:CR=1 FL=1
MGLFILIASLFVLTSCSKKADESLNKEQKELDKNLEATSIDENDFTEADEDLMTVDYKEFYDQLAPKLVVTAKSVEGFQTNKISGFSLDDA